MKRRLQKKQQQLQEKQQGTKGKISIFKQGNKAGYATCLTDGSSDAKKQTKVREFKISWKFQKFGISGFTGWGLLTEVFRTFCF